MARQKRKGWPIWGANSSISNAFFPFRRIISTISDLLRFWLASEKSDRHTPLSSFKGCPGGGIGRRGGFKIRFLRKCGFESHPGYQASRGESRRRSLPRRRKTKPGSKPTVSYARAGFPRSNNEQVSSTFPKTGGVPPKHCLAVRLPTSLTSKLLPKQNVFSNDFERISDTPVYLSTIYRVLFIFRI